MTTRTFLTRRWLPLLTVLAVPTCTGCFSHHYYVDPKPPRVTYFDLRPNANPQPVHLSFDVYNENGPFPSATTRLAPQVLRVIDYSQLFSSIAKVSSENIPRLQIVLTERELPEVGSVATQPVPPNVTLGLPGTRGGVIYTLTATYQPTGKPAIKKVYNHAVHVAGGGPKPAGVKSMRAINAVEDAVEQMILTFLIDLQKAGNL